MFKPMKGSPIRTLDDLRFPLLATPKLDGIRCIKLNGNVLAASLKPIRNYHIVEAMQRLPDGADGELMVAGGFQATQSGVMSFAGQPDFQFHCFDMVQSGPYSERVKSIEPWQPFVVPVLPTLVESLRDYEAFEERCLEQGYEGTVCRLPSGPYKFGRSSLREFYMVKHKRVQDDEATIVGFRESLENCNEATRDELGRLRRSGAQEGLMGKGTLGGIICVHPVFGEIDVSPGKLTHALRQEIWDNQERFLGRAVTFMYQSVGVKDRPRFPRFKCFREGAE